VIRRQFITLLGGAAAWPVVASAQRPKLPMIGMLSLFPTDTGLPQIAGFRQGITEAGLVEGQTVAIEYRSAYLENSRLPALATELVTMNVDVIAATGSSAPALAAKAATSTIPIVFQTGGDPVQDGLVTSLNRPGGNITGVSRMSVTLGPKRLELLHELIPKATTIAFLVNPSNPTSATQLREMEEPARSLGLSLLRLEASRGNELDVAFASMARQGAPAMLIANDPFFNSRRVHIAMLGERYSAPIFASSREMTAAGGLMSYSASLPDSYRQVGIYVGRILKGEKPADLPIIQPTKFELVINLKVAKSIGLAIPESLLLRADEVIE
jgi:putative tryptophan/tyrosine transport system substrate-binding protein